MAEEVKEVKKDSKEAAVLGSSKQKWMVVGVVAIIIIIALLYVTGVFGFI